MRIVTLNLSEGAVCPVQEEAERQTMALGEIRGESRENVCPSAQKDPVCSRENQEQSLASSLHNNCGGIMRSVIRSMIPVECQKDRC